MASDEAKKREEELDKFWQIDQLLPKRKPVRYEADTSAVDVVVDPPAKEPAPAGKRPESGEAIPPPGASDAPERHYIPPHTADEAKKPTPDDEYVPENALIRKVRVYRRRGTYSYNQQFLRDAIRLYAIRGEKCEPVSFFSYVPQYSQLNRAQLEWYLWWRDCFRHGEALPTDYSYVLLYAYEIINLSGKIDAAKSQAELLRLWRIYRETYRQLDFYLPEWICDYSLIHHLPTPVLPGDDCFREILLHCTLKEFYVSANPDTGYVFALMAFCSNYDYHNSKFCTDEFREDYDRVIPAALARATDYLSGQGKLFSGAGMDDSRMVRDAYTGALCAETVKRRVEVEYCSFSRTHELRFLVTDVIKYSENKLRAALGIRSRLTVYALPTAVRKLLDEFLPSVLPARTHPVGSEAEAAPAPYEILYDLPKKPLSLADAAEIERLSWDTTEKLLDAFDGVEESSAPAPAPAEAEPVVPGREEPQPPEACAPLSPAAENGEEPDALAAALRPYEAFLRAAERMDAAEQRALARASGKLPELLADEINGIAAELTGDILLEENGNGFAVIDEYRPVVEAILCGIGKE